MPRKKASRNFLSENIVFTQEDKLHWLRLIRSENVGPISFFHLLNRFGTAQEALKRLPQLAQRAGRTLPLAIPSMKDVKKEAEAYEKIGAHLIAHGEDAYPSVLKSIPDAPPLISAIGRIDILNNPSFAIVGARNSSAIGCKTAEVYGKSLAEEGLVIVSGMARGIDTHAHKGALQTPCGTVAVLAGGVDHIYPPENKALYHTISREGVLLSEMPIGTIPQAHFFPRRNRIISGLCWGVLVVEAAIKSGSLVTAQCAAEQGRDVFAIPGHPFDPRSRGANELIRQGSTLVQSTEQILDEYRAKNSFKQMAEEEEEYDSSGVNIAEVSDKEIENIHRNLSRFLSTTPVRVDELVRLCESPLSLVRASLFEMEIAGKIEHLSNDSVCLRSVGASDPVVSFF